MTSPPRYQEIKRYILERIKSGVFPTHHKIPSEEHIARDFRVSRMTANRAIRELAHAGYLSRHPGLGTFVTDRKAESPLLEIHNIADEVGQRGHVYRNDVVKYEVIAADDEIALQLGVRLGVDVFHTILVHYENDVPIQLENRYVNAHWVPHYLNTDFAERTPNEVLVATCPISRIEHAVEAVEADTQIANLLEIEVGTACLCVARRTWSDNHLISYARLSHPGTRYKLRSVMAPA